MHILTDRNHITIDTRCADEFLEHHVKGSVFIGFGSRNFKYWLELLLPDKNIAMDVICDLAEREQIMTVIHQLGYLNANVKLLDPSGSKLQHITANDFNSQPLTERSAILDVREVEEFQQSALEHAENLPLSTIIDGKLPLEDKEYIIHCRSGYRSLIALSLLKLLGWCKLIHLDGGYQQLINKK